MNNYINIILYYKIWVPLKNATKKKMESEFSEKNDEFYYQACCFANNALDYLYFLYLTKLVLFVWIVT